MLTRPGEPRSEYAPPCPWKPSTCVALTALAYLALARFSLLFVVQPEQVAGFWLPNGLLIGVMIVRSRRDWGRLLASGCVANFIANLWAGNLFGTSLGFALANGVETCLAVWALTRYAGAPVTLGRLKEVFGLVAVAAIPVCASGGLLGAAIVTLGSSEPAFWPVWRVWMVADLLGVLLVTPLVIAWSTTGALEVRLLSRVTWMEAVTLLLVVLGMTLLVFGRTIGLSGRHLIGAYALFPFLLWAALRFGLWGGSTATLVVSFVAVWLTAQGRGPFATSDGLVTVQMLAVQVFLVVSVLTTLVVVAVMAERTRAQEQLELVIHGTDAGIWDWNILSNEVFLSPRWKSMLGYQDHELPSRFEVWESRIHPEDHSRALAAFRDHLEGKSDHYESEHRLRHKDGTFRWVLSRGSALRDYSGRPVRIAGSHLDVTAIKQAEAALRESERHFHAAFEDSPIGMDLVDLRGRFVRVNVAYSRMIGYTQEQMVGMHIRDVTYPDDLPVDEKAMQQFLTGSSRTQQSEKRYVRSDGSLIWALLNVTMIADAEGRPFQFFGQVQDITELKQTEETLRCQAQELERSNQELDDFAYIASHDLKTPLRGINNLSKWIDDDAKDSLSEASREHLRKLRQRVARLERLLDDLLQYSRAGQQLGDLMTVQTGPLVRSVVDFLTPPAGFIVTIADGMPQLKTYKTPLELVFRNLIDNAIKHHHRADGRIEVSAAAKGRLVEFTIRDDGPGIPSEYHERVFRMFQTLKPRDEVEGSGIGLAVVRKVVERQGGQVTVESQPGHGTAFRFTWPNSVSHRGERRDRDV